MQSDCSAPSLRSSSELRGFVAALQNTSDAQDHSALLYIGRISNLSADHFWNLKFSNNLIKNIWFYSACKRVFKSCRKGIIVSPHNRLAPQQHRHRWHCTSDWKDSWRTPQCTCSSVKEWIGGICKCKRITSPLWSPDSRLMETCGKLTSSLFQKGSCWYTWNTHVVKTVTDF